MRKRGESRGGLRTSRAPALEQLEPRPLLKGDLSGSGSWLLCSTASDGSAIIVDSEWFYVDLGSVYTIHQVVLRWEVAYGRGYKIQVSNDASTWTDVYSTTAGDGGVDEITLASPASGRYVRLLGTQQATAYGYSLWEFEVYA